MRKLSLGAIALAVGTMIGSTASHATFIVDVFTNQPLNVINDVQNFAGGTPAGTFITNSINFASPPGANTIGGFASSFGAASAPPSIAGLSLQNTVWRFQSTDAITTATPLAAVAAQGLPAVPVTPGNVTIRHDDGVFLGAGIQNVPGAPIILDASEATSPRTDTAPFGNAPRAVTLFYAEGFGQPAVLQANLTNAVPEPASLALLGAALIGMVPMLRRRRKTS